MKIKGSLFLGVFVMFMMAGISNVFAHCEIPCGIYTDNLRFDMMREDIITIEKSMNEIVKLSQETPVNYNQLVRWIDTKDVHAEKIQEIVWQYFLTQRIKPDQPQYQEKLTTLHQMLISAMKCKQTTDLANTTALKTLVDKFEALYMGEAEKAHMEEHKTEHK